MQNSLNFLDFPANLLYTFSYLMSPHNSKIEPQPDCADATAPEEPTSLTILLTSEQAAGLLRVTTRTLRKLAIPRLMVGGSIRYRRADIERFLLDNTRNPVTGSA